MCPEGEPFIFPGFLVRTPASLTSWALIGACSMKHLLRSGNHLIHADDSVIVGLSGVSLAEPLSVLLCRNSKKKRTRGRKRGWSLSGNGRKGKKNESGRENGGTARGRRSGNGRGKERGNGSETKTEIAGPETESGTEIGKGTEALTRVLIAVDPGNDKNITTCILSVSILISRARPKPWFKIPRQLLRGLKSIYIPAER